MSIGTVYDLMSMETGALMADLQTLVIYTPVAQFTRKRSQVFALDLLETATG
jgi:hypothetical protein